MFSGVRGRSPSIKRLRNNDGISVDVTGEGQTSSPRPERGNSRPPQRKCVVGTSNNSVLTCRKMRSPPADIFVWGIHPDTTIQDIVADLAQSGVIIEEKDVQKKSRPEANLMSFKISVKAEDLQVALNPSVWPLRVKVREFIHYSYKGVRQPGQQQGQPFQQGQIARQHQGQVGGVQSVGGAAQQGLQQGQIAVGGVQSVGGAAQQGVMVQHGGVVQHTEGHREQGGLSVATNRFAVLSDGVGGDVQSV